MTSHSEHTYKIIELVGSSNDGVDAAIDNAITRASQSLSNLDWFEVREIRGNIADGKRQWTQVKLGVGFRVLDSGDVAREA